MGWGEKTPTNVHFKEEYSTFSKNLFIQWQWRRSAESSNIENTGKEEKLGSVKESIAQILEMHTRHHELQMMYIYKEHDLKVEEHCV